MLFGKMVWVKTWDPMPIWQVRARIRDTAFGLAMVDASGRGVAVEDVVSATATIHVFDRARAAEAILSNPFLLRHDTRQVLKLRLGEVAEKVSLSACRSKGGKCDGKQHQQGQNPGGSDHSRILYAASRYEPPQVDAMEVAARFRDHSGLR